MIPTFVITLREGVEAALIVGIIAAFLVKEGRRDALRQMWLGIAIAVALCLGAAIALEVASQELPQKEQEGLETVIGLIAVGAVTYMIVWMRRNARGIKAALEGEAASALAAGSTLALVGMAFLAVLREGLETSVFLLAAFQQSTDTAAAGAGAVLGLVAALAIGFGLYRGGVRINLSRFFRITGLVLVFVAAGLLASRRPHRPRGRLDQRPAGPGGRPQLAGQAGHRDRLAADRDAGPAAAPGDDRSHRLRCLRGADGPLRPLAGPAARPRHRAAPGAAGEAGAGREPGVSAGPEPR